MSEEQFNGRPIKFILKDPDEPNVDTVVSWEVEHVPRQGDTLRTAGYLWVVTRVEFRSELCPEPKRQLEPIVILEKLHEISPDAPA
ncbi:MAG: hypothetical protein Aurels2KO_25640 [Aureliella sp.]